MRASDRGARASSIRDVSPAQLQTDDKSLRQAFATLLRTSSAHWPAFAASARASFPAPSMVSGKAPARLGCPSPDIGFLGVSKPVAVLGEDSLNPRFDLGLALG